MIHIAFFYEKIFLILVFGMKSIMAVRTSSNTLVEYWWDLTPHNIHMIVINYLYDSDNRRCNQW